MAKVRLFVGNVAENIEEKDLLDAFSNYGDVTNVDLKCKPNDPSSKKFAFISMSSNNANIESCIQHFSSEKFQGQQLYVTRARESFLERLERERKDSNYKPHRTENSPVNSLDNESIYPNNRINVAKKQIGKQENEMSGRSPRKRTNSISNDKAPKVFKNTSYPEEKHDKAPKVFKNTSYPEEKHVKVDSTVSPKKPEDKSKKDADMKRMESIKKKRQDFVKKQMIIKNGLTAIDKKPNVKIVFSDNEESSDLHSNKYKNNSYVNGDKSKSKPKLFDDADLSDEDVNFEIKKQYEGKKGQKVLELQSRFKSDKRFMIDERFVDEEEEGDDDEIELNEKDEKTKQLNILQDVLGVEIKSRSTIPDEIKDKKKIKSKLGMLRFDPHQPEHAKFLAPVVVETIQERNKRMNKNKNKEGTDEQNAQAEQTNENRVEVSKETFYKVSDTLKEAIAQPSSFSLRSLFNKNDNADDNIPSDKDNEDQESFIPLKPQKESKSKNPLDRGERNPFKYDSSDSEAEENDVTSDPVPLEATEPKAVWKEKLFFSNSDSRLKDGIAFFNRTAERGQKERRELKSVMKKRLHNRERKDQMFKKKIGGRRKVMKKNNWKKVK